MNWVLKFLDAVDEQSGKSDSTLGVSSGKVMVPTPRERKETN